MYVICFRTRDIEGIFRLKLPDFPDFALAHYVFTLDFSDLLLREQQDLSGKLIVLMVTKPAAVSSENCDQGALWM